MTPADLRFRTELRRAVDAAIPPLYVQVREIVRERIDDGTYKYCIPPEYELALEFDVAYSTVRRAIRFLKDEGLLTAKPGHGTFVARDYQAARGRNGKSE
jgi:DNA-binding GntR family transcriptional regulator